MRLAVMPVAVAHAAAEADRAAGAATPVDIGKKKGSLNWQWLAAWAG